MKQPVATARPTKWTRRNIIWNYALNLFMPYLCIIILTFHAMGWRAFEPYAIIVASVFIGRFAFKTGYSVAYCKCKKIDLDL